MAFSADGQRLASGLGDGTIRLWDLRQPEPAPRILRGHEARVETVAISADGQHLASGSEDGTTRLWIVHPEDVVCKKVERNLTLEEWYQFVGSAPPYERTCPNLPIGKGTPG
jgi:WD40 repeat protein